MTQHGNLNIPHIRRRATTDQAENPTGEQEGDRAHHAGILPDEHPPCSQA